MRAFAPTAAAGAALLALALPGAAAAVSANGGRPIVPGPSFGGERSLQTVLDTHFPDGAVVDVEQNQLPEPVSFRHSDQIDEPVSVRLVEEIAGFADRNVFGIYPQGDPGLLVPLFSGSDGPGALRSFRLVGGDLLVDGVLAAAGFGDPGDPFGFYLGSGGGEVFFTEDAHNPGGHPQALILDLARTMPTPRDPTALVVAFEDLPFENGDRDYQDLVVEIDGVRFPTVLTPEPGTLGLVALSLTALLSLRRLR